MGAHAVALHLARKHHVGQSAFPWQKIPLCASLRTALRDEERADSIAIPGEGRDYTQQRITMGKHEAGEARAARSKHQTSVYIQVVSEAVK